MNLDAARVARLATVRQDGRPHVVPICFALEGDTLYTAVDAKPKSTRRLRRLANIEANPQCEVVIDHWDEDWSRLWWVRLSGRARIVEHDANALELLQTKYPQYRDDPPAGPFIVLAVESRREWSGAGRLDSAPQPGKPKGERMAILIMGEIPANSDQYDQISRQMGISDDNLPEGLISHVAGPTDGGMEVVDVWESREAFDRFIENQLMPAVQALGIDLQGEEPRIVQVHNMFSAR